MVTQVMANDMTSKMAMEMPIDGNTPIRYFTIYGLGVNTKGGAAKGAAVEERIQ